MLDEFSDALRIGLGKGLPDNVPPMAIHMKEDARFMRAAQR